MDVYDIRTCFAAASDADQMVLLIYFIFFLHQIQNLVITIGNRGASDNQYATTLQSML